MGKRLLPLPITDARRRSRTVHDYPGIISVQRQDCGNDFFAPDEPEIDEHGERIRDFLKTPSCAVAAARIRTRTRDILVRDPLRDQLGSAALPGCGRVYGGRGEGRRGPRAAETRIPPDPGGRCDLTLRHPEDPGEIWRGSCTATRGKGRAIFAAFLHLKYIAKRSEIRELFLFDVDVIVGQYRPLEYLAYPHVSAPSPDRLFVLTAQNNARRDNHYLVVPERSGGMRADLGRHYVRHFDKIVWSLTGEMSMRWSECRGLDPVCRRLWHRDRVAAVRSGISPRDRERFAQVERVAGSEPVDERGWWKRWSERALL